MNFTLFTSPSDCLCHPASHSFLHRYFLQHNPSLFVRKLGEGGGEANCTPTHQNVYSTIQSLCKSVGEFKIREFWNQFWAHNLCKISSVNLYNIWTSNMLLIKHKSIQLKCPYINCHIDHFCSSPTHLSSRCFIKIAAAVQITAPSFSQQRWQQLKYLIYSSDVTVWAADTASQSVPVKCTKWRYSVSACVLQSLMQRNGVQIRLRAPGGGEVVVREAIFGKKSYVWDVEFLAAMLLSKQFFWDIMS